MTEIKGSVTAAKGFMANGIYCGIRKNKEKKDLALIYSEVPAVSAAVYTTNKVKGAPLVVTKSNLENGLARAVICNSGNANTCNADGVEVAESTCAALASELGIGSKDIIVASTGVIGQPLNLPAILSGIPELVSGMSAEKSGDAANAILTTDLKTKEAAVEFELSGKVCRMGGIAKGSGMINPNMATMLVFITTDAAIESKMLNTAIKSAADETFNMLSIDGDTSTNDMLSIMANGLAGNAPVSGDCPDYQTFYSALVFLCSKLCKMIAADGEGATKLLEVHVKNANTVKDARSAAKSVVSSSLTKAAMFGADANWGRVLCALGYSGADIDVNRIDIILKSSAGSVEVCRDGSGVDFSEEKAKEVLSEAEIIIEADLKTGKYEARAYGCDLTYDYVKINGDYRT